MDNETHINKFSLTYSVVTLVAISSISLIINQALPLFFSSLKEYDIEMPLIIHYLTSGFSFPVITACLGGCLLAKAYLLNTSRISIVLDSTIIFSYVVLASLSLIAYIRAMSSVMNSLS